MDKCTFDRADANIELQDSLMDLCEQVWDETDERAKKALLISGFKQLGVGYESDSLSDLSDYIKEYVNDNYPDLVDIIPINTEVYLMGSGSNVDSEIIETDTKVQALEAPELTKVTDIPQAGFITSAYGTAIDVQMQMENSLKANIVNCFVVNRMEGTITDSVSDLNAYVRNYQESLLANITEFLEDKYSNMESDRYNKEEALSILEDLQMYKDGAYTDALSVINRLSDPFLNIGRMTSDILNKHYNDSLLGYNPSKLFLNAYNSYVLLNNFDALLQSKLGKTLKISANLFNQFTTENKYRLSGEHANNNTSWRTTEDIHPHEEIDDISKLLIETTPIYAWQSSTPMSGRMLGTQEFNYIVSEVKDLIYNPAAQAIKFDGTFFTIPGYADLRKHREYIMNKTVYDLITDVRESPLRALPILFDILTNPTFASTHSSTLLGNFYKPQLDLIYSIHQGFFNGNNSSSLLSVTRKNPEKINYLSYITQIADSTAIMKYTQYYQNEDGNVVLRTLKDSTMSTVRMRVENKINGMLSKVAPFRYDDYIEKYDAVWEDNKFTFTIPEASIQVIFTPSADKNKAFEFKRIAPDGSTEKIPFLEGKSDWDALLPFINDFTKVDFDAKSAYMKSYLSLKTINGETQYTQAATDLLQFSTSIFFNSYFSHEFTDEYDSYFTLKEKIADVFGDSDKVAIIKSAGEISLINNSYIPILSDLATANSMATGLYASSTVKDAEGNSQSTNTITRLFDSFSVQWNKQCKYTPNSASRGFSLLTNPNLLTGVVVSNEANLGDTVKKHSSFNVAESYYSALVYDFVGGLIKSADGKNNHDSGFMPSVNSDKTIILKEMIKLDSVSPLNIPYNKLNNDQIKTVIRKEFGGFYSTVLNNISNDYSKLSAFAPTVGVNVTINPFSNFQELNDEYGKGAADTLLMVVREYNKAHPRSIIELRDQIHFINKGKIAFNNTLISLTNRFNPTYFASKGIDNISDIFGYPSNPNDANSPRVLTSESDFWIRKEREILATLLDNNLQIETTNASGDLLTSPEIQYFADRKEWITSTTKRVILGKFITPEGRVFPISSWSDFGKLSYTEVDEKGQSVVHDYTSGDFDITKLKGRLELHPIISQHNLLDYLFTQEFMLTTVGGHHSHPAKGRGISTDLEEEAARYNAQHKRNVAFTASMKIFQQNILNGIPSEYNIAIIQDLKSMVFNIMGDEDKAAPYDGSTFVNPFVVYLENYSLGGSAAGVDKKQFGHAYKEDTGSGICLKTAGFGLTNDRMRNCQFYQLMMKKMTNRVWTDENGNPYVGDITRNYLGKAIEFNPIYYKVNGQFRMINNITSIGNNAYQIDESVVNQNGTIQEQLPTRAVENINTNFALWNLFGGMTSHSLIDNTLIPSEDSVTNVVKIMNSIGNQKNSTVDTQNDLYQPLKHSDIHYVPTAGAIKQGAANINTPSAYTDDVDYNISTMSTRNLGIQLDATHHADESNLSIMTQVISSLSSRGYTADQAMEVYDALSSMTKMGVKAYWDGYTKFLETDNPEQFQDVITKTIIKSIVNSTSKDGGTVQAVARDLINLAKEGKEISFKQTQGIIPYSDASVFNQLVSTITSTLNRSSIRVKFPGLLAVLNPSHGIWKLYGDRKLESFNNEEEIQALQQEYDTKPLENIADVELGKKYKVVLDGVTTIREIATPQQYWDLKTELAGKSAELSEYIIDGRDLGAYNIKFKDIAGNAYNLWDLDIIKTLYDYRKALDDGNIDVINNIVEVKKISTNPKEALKQMNTALQSVLEAITTGKSDWVFANGIRVQVDRASVTTKAYELIVPKVHASKFALKGNEDLNTIKNDPYFFLKRMVSNWESRMDDKDFDFELKKLNGSHVYIIDAKQFKGNTSLTEKTISTRTEDGKIYRKGIDGEDIHRIASEKDRIFIDANGSEVIVTEYPDFYIDSVHYHTLRVSSTAILNPNIDTLIQPIVLSTNKVAQRLTKYIGTNPPVQALTRLNNNYQTSIKSIKANPEATVKDPAIAMMYQSAREIHTSFDKSLDFLAARIPSQTMQSFMPMKAVAFDNPNVNSAYVNYWQIWLQGSDFDIDKVSLLSYSFDKTGKFISWSPYFNLNSKSTLRASEKIPFPTNTELELVPTNDTSLTNWAHQFVGSGNLFNFSGSEVVFLPDYDENNELGTIEKLSSFLRMVKANGSKLYIPANSNLPFDKIKKIVDKHNMYTTKKGEDQSMEMLKNFISTYMYNISIDPVNLIQSQSPIDLGEPQTAAKGSSAGKAVKSFTPGNNVNKHISLIENMVGKEVIGISAAGMKDFFALTQYFNITLRDGNSEEQGQLIFHKNIAGQPTSMLANSFTPNAESLKESNIEVYDAYMKVDNTKDAALVLSALLSCATDNAKELILAKINAGADMVGLYIYGTVIGMDFSKIAQVMMSNTARVISRVKNGNIFNKNNGMPFLQSVFDYFDEGISVDGQSVTFLNDIIDAMYPDKDNTKLKKQPRKAIYYYCDKLGDDYQFDLDKKMDFIKSLDKLASRLTYENEKVKAYKFLDSLRNFVNDLSVVRGETLKNGAFTYNPYWAIKDLYYGSSELRRLGSVLGLNQGLKTDVAGKLGFIRKFENLLDDRVAEIQDRELELLVNLNGNKVSLSSALDTLNNYLDNPAKKTNPTKPTDFNYNISFSRFMTDETYRNAIISFYGAIKHTFNILDTVWTLPHFRGYVETAFMDYEAQKAISSKFRGINTIGDDVIKFYNFKSSKDIKNTYKGVQSFLDNALINAWMKSSNKTINIQEGVEIFISGNRTKTTEGDTPIMLGTPTGNASFKLWMESTVIPDLKEGILSKKAKIYMNNKFIKDLSPVRVDRTVTRNSTFIYTLPVSTLPSSDSEKAAYTMYKSEFNKLHSLSYYGYPITDLFFYYNLINFRNATTQNSLTPLFEDMLGEGSAPLLKEYNSFVSIFDTKSDLEEGIDYILDDAYRWCAPMSSTYATKAALVRSYDYNSMQVKLYQKSLDDSSQYDSQYDEMGYVEESDVEESNPNEGDDDNYIPTVKEGYTINPDYLEVADSYDRRYFLTEQSIIDNYNKVRISANITASLQGEKITSVTYNSKTYTREEVLEKLTALGGSESDLKPIYETKRIDDTNVRVLSNSALKTILDHIFNNPC